MESFKDLTLRPAIAFEAAPHPAHGVRAYHWMAAADSNLIGKMRHNFSRKQLDVVEFVEHRVEQQMPRPRSHQFP